MLYCSCMHFFEFVLFCVCVFIVISCFIVHTFLDVCVFVCVFIVIGVYATKQTKTVLFCFVA